MGRRQGLRTTAHHYYTPRPGVLCVGHPTDLLGGSLKEGRRKGVAPLEASADLSILPERYRVSSASRAGNLLLVNAPRRAQSMRYPSRTNFPAGRLLLLPR